MQTSRNSDGANNRPRLLARTKGCGTFFPRTFLLPHILPPRGATTAEKLRGTKVWVPTPGCLRWVLGAGGVAVRVREYQPRKFLKTQMLNPAFWWLLCLLVGSLGREISCFFKSNTLLVPNLKIILRLSSRIRGGNIRGGGRFLRGRGGDVQGEMSGCEKRPSSNAGWIDGRWDVRRNEEVDRGQSKIERSHQT